ncbi:MAG TPA: phage portal protein [Sunxiuqinia sp.]|nr:phage portal protein [Sunxiuqinia sp.]
MGIFASGFQPKNLTIDEVGKRLLEIYGGGSTASGVTVTSESAMRLLTVQNCVRMRASTLSRLPCHIMRQIDRLKEKATDFYLYDLLLHQPNSWMTAPEFWAMAEAHVSLRGNFVAYKSQLPGRPIRELLPINPDSIQSIEQKEDYRIEYKIKLKNGFEKTLTNKDVFHLKSLSLDGVVGLNPIQYARESIGKGLASIDHISKWFSKGVHPSAVIQHPLQLSSPKHAELREELKKKYEGLGNDWEFMLIDEAMKIDFPEIKLVDQQYLEQMKLDEAQICGLFRVPLMLVNAGDKAPTYASAEQFMLFYAVFSIDSVLYESAIRRDLLTDEERKEYFAKFNVDALLRGDFQTRMEGYKNAINCEMINPNEAREKEDMNPYSGGEIYRTRTSTTKEPDTKAKQSRGAEKE